MQKAYSLIEFLIVIAVVGILASIILLGASGYRNKARLANTKQFSQGVRSSVGAYMVGEWKFDEESGATATDTSGNNNHGTIYGATRTDDAVFGQALSFDGVDDYIKVPAAVSSNIGDSITISAWVYGNAFDESSTYRGIVCDEYGTGDFNVEFTIHLRGAAHILTAGFYDGSWHILADSTGFSTGQWTHVVATYDGHYIKLYKNGVLLGVSSNLNLPLPSGSTGWRIGRRWDSGGAGNMWDGLIDDVAIYSEAFTMAQVQELYLAGLPSHQNELAVGK